MEKEIIERIELSIDSKFLSEDAMTTQNSVPPTCEKKKKKMKQNNDYRECLVTRSRLAICLLSTLTLKKKKKQTN